jgi:ubiquinone/menaquinone biosynthesis C-methylase UbiE
VAKRLDIGCGKLDEVKIQRYQRYLGNYVPQEYTGVDRVKLPGVDVVCDITQGLPFEDETVDEIICIHVLEHIKNLEFVMREFRRILKRGGVLRIWVPHCFSPGAFGDSTHVRFFTFETFLQFDAGHPQSYYFDFHFKFIKSRMQLLRRWYKPNIVERFLEKVINWKQRQGERFLKILPYKDWEVYFELMKAPG